MTYEESAQLMLDPTFRGRIKVACLKYADYVLTSPNLPEKTNAKLNWAQATFREPDTAAMRIQPAVVMDVGVQEHGSSISDEALSRAVEAVVQKMI